MNNDIPTLEQLLVYAYGPEKGKDILNKVIDSLAAAPDTKEQESSPLTASQLMPHNLR